MRDSYSQENVWIVCLDCLSAVICIQCHVYAMRVHTSIGNVNIRVEGFHFVWTRFWVSLHTPNMFDLFVHGLSLSILVLMCLLMVCPSNFVFVCLCFSLLVSFARSLYGVLVSGFVSRALPCTFASASSWSIRFCIDGIHCVSCVC